MDPSTYDAAKQDPQAFNERNAESYDTSCTAVWNFGSDRR
jgi:hypothetical protein